MNAKERVAMRHQNPTKKTSLAAILLMTSLTLHVPPARAQPSNEVEYTANEARTQALQDDAIINKMNERDEKYRKASASFWRLRKLADNKIIPASNAFSSIGAGAFVYFLFSDYYHVKAFLMEMGGNSLGEAALAVTGAVALVAGTISYGGCLAFCDLKVDTQKLVDSIQDEMENNNRSLDQVVLAREVGINSREWALGSDITEYYISELELAKAMLNN
jgi:hypothetical protein